MYSRILAELRHAGNRRDTIAGARRRRYQRDSMLKLYNTLTRRIEPFTPIDPGRVRMYSCGPTVYRYIHIGNLRTFLMADWLRRTLTELGYEVRHVKNITDVGHMRVEMLDRGEPMPAYLRDHCVYYAGPAKTPEGYASGSFGPTTAGRMDSYVDLFQKAGGSFVMLAKGNRSAAVTKACQENGGFYLGSIGGPAARLAQDNIRKVEVLDFPELGMEAVWRIEVEDFPAFVVVDDKGNDFFAETLRPVVTSIPVGPPR